MSSVLDPCKFQFQYFIKSAGTKLKTTSDTSRLLVKLGTRDPEQSQLPSRERQQTSESAKVNLEAQGNIESSATRTLTVSDC